MDRLRRGRGVQKPGNYLLAEMSDADGARTRLARARLEQPELTPLKKLWTPLTEATLLLAEGKPEAALDVLAGTDRFENRWGDITLLRGRALLAAGKPSAAAEEFKPLVDHPRPGPAATVYPLALISLARARVAAGGAAGAREA